MDLVFKDGFGNIRYRGHFVSVEVLVRSDLQDVLGTIDQFEDARASMMHEYAD